MFKTADINIYRRHRGHFMIELYKIIGGKYNNN